MLFIATVEVNETTAIGGHNDLYTKVFPVEALNFSQATTIVEGHYLNLNNHTSSKYSIQILSIQGTISRESIEL